MDIVKRYDIDGMHFDDYFYPYPSYNGGADFPDEDSWAAYQSAGGKLSRGDWRREQVNRFIERVYASIKAEKKHVKFGLSPFGVWRPGYPSSVQGFDQYDQLYADARLWLNKGWVDYFTPQLYWPVNQIPQSFPVLLGWWQQENTYQRHLWPGMNVGRGGDEKNADELVNQIMITRGMLPQSSGAVHWSISGITRHAALADTLIKGPYKQQALVPASPWLGDSKPVRPMLDIRQEREQAVITWTHPREKEIFRWVLHYRYGDRWDYTIFNRAPRQTTLALTASGKADAKLNRVRLVAVDRLGNESEAAVGEIH